MVRVCLLTLDQLTIAPNNLLKLGNPALMFKTRCRVLTMVIRGEVGELRASQSRDQRLVQQRVPRNIPGIALVERPPDELPVVVDKLPAFDQGEPFYFLLASSPIVLLARITYP